MFSSASAPEPAPAPAAPAVPSKPEAASSSERAVPSPPGSPNGKARSLRIADPGASPTGPGAAAALTPISVFRGGAAAAASPQPAAPAADVWEADFKAPTAYRAPSILRAEPGKLADSSPHTVSALQRAMEERHRWDYGGGDPELVIHKTPSKKIQSLQRALSDLDLKSPAVIAAKRRADALKLLSTRTDEPAPAAVPGVGAGALVEQAYDPTAILDAAIGRRPKRGSTHEVEFDYVDPEAGMGPDMTIG